MTLILNILYDEIGLSVGSVHTIMTERLNWRKVCPTVFNHNRKHVEWPTVLIICRGMPGKGMNSWHEWCLEMSLGVHFKPESKRQSLQWKHPGPPPPKKFKAIHTSAGKVMLTLVFDQDGPLLIDFLQRGTTVNAQHYSQNLTIIRQAIKLK